jgi:hypothetical protein
LDFDNTIFTSDKNYALMWILSQQVPVVSRKIVWEIRNEMQAESGFGSR